MYLHNNKFWDSIIVWCDEMGGGVMSVSKEDVIKVSHLSMINIPEDQIDAMRDQLNSILHFIEQLNEVDCSSVVDGECFAESCRERRDVVEDVDIDLFSNAPECVNHMFVVPKITE